MSTYPSVILIVILAWWVGTGIVLRLQQRLNPESVYTRYGLTGVALLSLVLLASVREHTGDAGIFVAFAGAVVLWGCIELSYYLGVIAGTHRTPCPHAVSGWRKFSLALGTSIWHELLVLCTGGFLLSMLASASNTVGLYTYLVLWFMRWSAKLNLFFGVPNFSTAWIPERLSYVVSYIRTGTLSPFFIVSVPIAVIVAVQLFIKSNDASAAHPMMFAAPAVLLMLAIIEHLFMLVPFQESRMWDRLFNSKFVAKSHD